MTKTEIEKCLCFTLDPNIRRQGFITRSDVARAFGSKDPHTVDRFLDGLEAIDGKYFLITDVAGVLQSRASSK